MLNKTVKFQATDSNGNVYTLSIGYNQRTERVFVEAHNASGVNCSLSNFIVMGSREQGNTARKNLANLYAKETRFVAMLKHVNNNLNLHTWKMV